MKLNKFETTINLVRKRISEFDSSIVADKAPHKSLAHILWMCDEIQGNMEAYKAHRWIGYILGVMEYHELMLPTETRLAVAVDLERDRRTQEYYVGDKDEATINFTFVG